MKLSGWDLIATDISGFLLVAFLFSALTAM